MENVEKIDKYINFFKKESDLILIKNLKKDIQKKTIYKLHQNYIKGYYKNLDFLHGKWQLYNDFSNTNGIPNRHFFLAPQFTNKNL